MIPEASSFSCRHLWSTLVFHIVGLEVNSVEIKDLPLSLVQRLYFFGNIRLSSPQTVLDITFTVTLTFYSETNVCIKHGCHFLLRSKHGNLLLVLPYETTKTVVLYCLPQLQSEQINQLFSDQLCHAIEIILYCGVTRWHRSLQDIESWLKRNVCKY